jgi:hypothetical protein
LKIEKYNKMPRDSQVTFALKQLSQIDRDILEYNARFGYPIDTMQQFNTELSKLRNERAANEKRHREEYQHGDNRDSNWINR